MCKNIHPDDIADTIKKIIESGDMPKFNRPGKDEYYLDIS